MSEAKKSKSKMLKVLIIEDEKPMAKALELKLTSSGFEAIAVFDGKEGLENLKKGKFDFALLDLVLPEMDGFQVLESVKDLKIKTKIIVASNLSQIEDEQRARDLGAVDYLIKSDIPISEIVEKLKSLSKSKPKKQKK